MTMEIRIGLEAGHKPDLIQLFCATFSEVIVPVFGSAVRCQQLLKQSLATDRILSAVSEGRFIGFAGLHFSGREWFNPDLGSLIQAMRWGTFRTVAVGIVLFERPKSDVLHLDTLAVHPDLRGRGVGTQLIAGVEALARAEGKRQVTLDAEDINPRAKQLYKRLGYGTDRFKKLPWPWSNEFAFSGSYRMSKDLQTSPR